MQSQIKKIGIFPLHPFLYPGGVKNHVLELKKYLKKKGYDCKIGVPRGSLTERYADKDIRLIGTALTIPLMVAMATWRFVPRRGSWSIGWRGKNLTFSIFITSVFTVGR